MLLALLLLPLQPAPEKWQNKVDTWVLQQAADGPTEFILYLDQQADLGQASQVQGKQQRGAYVYQQLTRTARLTQAPLLKALETWAAQHPGSIEYRSYWVANMIWVRGDAQVLQYLAQQPDIAHVFANPAVKLDEPTPPSAEVESQRMGQGIEWNIEKVGAPQVWATGFTGQGAVIGGQDTGYAWQHEAIKRQYRGWNGTTASHDYNWHDAIHTEGGGGICGPDSLVPCDDGIHGTHTMGIMVGDNGAGMQLGMAPGARWIGCRNMDQGWGKPSTYTECYQWFMAPTDLSGQNPNPALAPDILNNSWSCPPAEGCVGNEITLMNQVVDNVRAAGILSVHSAGNSGPTCGSINTPAAIYDSSFTVGNTMQDDQIAYNSSRGPVLANGLSLLKPDISAPGTHILSSIPSGYGYLSGTSMSGPHVAGLVALLISARPALAGHPEQIEDIIKQSAVPLTSDQECGDIPGSQVPNNTYGWGRIDAAKAIDLILPEQLTIQKTASTPVVWTGEAITYTIQVTNTTTTTPTFQIRVTDQLPANTSLITATLPFTQTGSTITWSFPVLDPGQNANLSLVLQANAQPGQSIVSQNYRATALGVRSAAGQPVTVSVIVNPTNGSILYYPFIGTSP